MSAANAVTTDNEVAMPHRVERIMVFLPLAMQRVPTLSCDAARRSPSGVRRRIIRAARGLERDARRRAEPGWIPCGNTQDSGGVSLYKRAFLEGPRNVVRLAELPVLIGRRPRLFLWFKAVVYLLLLTNVFLFLYDEGEAFVLAFPNGAMLSDVVAAFSATIDTIAWWFLLLLFELETFVLSPRWIERNVWTLHAVRLVMYAAVLWAFYGYCAAAAALMDARPVAGTSLCDFVGQERSFLAGLDENVAIDASNCASLDASPPFYSVEGGAVIADDAALRSVRPSTWVDVINAGAWLLVVLLLELDVRFEERGRFTGAVFRASYVAKVVLYSVLALVVVYWAVRAEPLDFWDAFLWLASFTFIEMNVLAHVKDQGPQRPVPIPAPS